MLNLPRTTTQFDVIPLAGGLDLATPQQSLKPGFCRDAINFECAASGGYTRILGYERFDGRPSPSGAAYSLLQINLTGSLAVGQTVVGFTSGSTAEVSTIAPGLISVTRQAGSFTPGEQLRVGGVQQAIVTAVGGSMADALADAGYLYAAGERYRASIGAVPGSGPVLGVVAFRGTVYALRNNGGGTAAALYKSSATGWQAVALPHQVAFTSGSGAMPAEGATITKGAVSAVVKRVVTESGDWLAGSAAGRFIIDAPTGGSFTAGALTAGATALLGAANSAITLLPGGRFRFDIDDAGFGVRIYGADGKNPGFEFDGTTWVPLKTGMVPDAPLHVAVHKNHVFFSFLNNAQHSGIGDPYRWTVISGGAALRVSEDITGFLRLPGDNATASLAMFTDNSVSVLYGKSAADWNLTPFEDGVGAKPDTAQVIGQAFMLDDRGVMGLAASQNFGNFDSSALTVNIANFLRPRAQTAKASLINREKSQYRLFFGDGFGLYCTLVNGRFLGAMPVEFKHVVRCAAGGEVASGSKASYFGSDDGWVYQLDVGTSFDGQSIQSQFSLTFAFQGSPRTRKRYRRASFEIQGDGYSEFSVGYELGYGSEDIEQPALTTNLTTKVSPVYWDQFTWDAFVWDGRAIAPSEMELGGTAENIAMRVEQDSALFKPFTINSVTLHFTPRRNLR